MMTQTCNPHTLKTEGRVHEFKTSLLCIDVLSAKTNVGISYAFRQAKKKKKKSFFKLPQDWATWGPVTSWLSLEPTVLREIEDQPGVHTNPNPLVVLA